MMSGDVLTTIYLLGAAQGIFLAALLATRHYNQVANKILAVAMLAFTLHLFTSVYHLMGWHAVAPHFIGVAFPIALVYGPILYLYARAVSQGATTFPRRWLWHFLPYGLVYVYLGPFFFRDGADKLAYYEAMQVDWPLDLAIINNLTFVHGLIYAGLTVRVLWQHRRRVKATFSSLDHINLGWLRYVTFGVVAVWGIALTLHIAEMVRPPEVATTDPVQGYVDYVALALVVFVYAIGYLGLRQPEVFTARTHALALIKNGAAPSKATDPTPPEATRRYAKSGMDEATAAALEARLVEAMTTAHLYRNGDLTLQDLAEALTASPHNISEVINTRLGQNFYDFVNSYRVRAVQTRLADPASHTLTLLGLAMEEGFRSKSSFNAVFKKHTGLTPSQWKTGARSASESGG